jgi:hypothetical protein
MGLDGCLDLGVIYGWQAQEPPHGVGGGVGRMWFGLTWLRLWPVLAVVVTVSVCLTWL